MGVIDLLQVKYTWINKDTPKAVCIMLFYLTLYHVFFKNNVIMYYFIRFN